MTSPTPPNQRAMIASLAAHRRWAATENRTAATAPARKAFEARFDRQVDPDNVLPPQERARRSANARRAYFIGLALRSARVRRAATAARRATPAAAPRGAEQDRGR